MPSAVAKALLASSLRSISSHSVSLPLRHCCNRPCTPISRHQFSRHFTVDVARELSAGKPDLDVSPDSTTQRVRAAEPTKGRAKDFDDGSSMEGRTQVSTAGDESKDPTVVEEAQEEIETPVEALEKKYEYENESPFTKTMKAFAVDMTRMVCDIIRREPQWEKVLASYLPPVPHRSNLFCPSFVRQLLQSKLFVAHRNELPLRYFLWISGEESFCPDRADSTALFHAFVDVGAWNAAVSLIRSTKCHLESSAIEPFLRMLCKNRAFDEVLEVFSIVKDKYGIMPSIPTWNFALWCSLWAGKTDLVWVLYNIMIDGGVCGDISTVECLIRVFCKEKRLLDGLSFLKQIAKAGLRPNAVTFNKLVHEFCQGGDLRKASDILRMMIAIGEPPNLYTYQAFIQAHCQCRRVDEALRIFDRLKRSGYTPNAVMYSTIINVLCKIGRMADVQKLWQEMTLLGTEPNRYTYAIMVNGYFKTGNICEAQNLYNEMLTKGHGENTVTCNTLIAGLCHNGRTTEALDVFEEMTKKGIKHDVITYNKLIQGFCNEGKTAEAMQLFRKLLETRIKPCEKSYVHLIRTLSKEGNVHEAAELFSDLENRGLKPSHVLHEHMIRGFCDVNDVDQGLAWFWKVLSSNLRPSEVIFNEFISRLSLANRVDDMFLILNLMFEFGYSMEKWTCSSLIWRLCRMNPDLAGSRLTEIIAVA